MQQGSALRMTTLNLKRMERLKTVIACAAVGCALLTWPMRDLRWLLASAILLLAVVIGSADVYRRFARVRGWRFALATVPLQLLYYVINGVSVCMGWVFHHTVGEPRPDPVVEAFAEVGVVRDPPLPSRRRSGAWAEPIRP